MSENIFSKNKWSDEKMIQDVPRSVHNRVLDALDSLEEKGQVLGIRYWLPRAAAACLLCILVSGVTVKAAEMIQSYRQRMAEMNEEELNKYYEVAFESHTIQFSRKFSKEESERYALLKNRYEKENLFPEGQLKISKQVEKYDGKEVTIDDESGVLYIPDGELTDEEMLQIIDFFHKRDFSIHVKAQEYYRSENPWLSRLQQMSSEEVDEVYLAMFTGEGEISGAYGRKLTEEERARYEELLKEYEENNVIPQGTLAVIQTSEEYTGQGIAICVKNSTFYFPEGVLSDEEILQLIDMEHKALYCLQRIGEEINMGFREKYPSR